MCGIAGIFRSNYNQEQNRILLTRMLSRIAHRGPDECGIYLGNELCLGTVRLSIIDLFLGQQPMHTYDYKLWIVFNGEIFNYRELKNQLLKKGHLFTTSSDTEVLLHLYQEKGEQCLPLLNGQFAFAIWDTEKHELFIARDRIGIRPLFYFYHNGTFIFSSEIKSILEFGEYSPAINETALSHIFTFWNTLSPDTIFKDIQELPPGHYLKIRENKLQITEYWRLEYDLSKKWNAWEPALEEFGELLNNAVQIRLRSDVPVAACLSGGLDSSAIVSIIKNLASDQLQTFSIGFAEKEFDESFFQNAVSSQLNTSHHAFYCNSDEIAKVFPSVIWHSETPLTRTAPAPMFLLSKKIRESNIKVIMTGEGADEMLGGYDIFKETLIRHFWSKQTNSRIRPLLFKRLYPYIPQISEMNAHMMKFIFGYKLQETYNPFYSHLLRWHNTSFLKRYLSEPIKIKTGSFNPLDDLLQKLPHDFNRWSSLEKAQWIETSVFLPGFLLSSQGDRMAMANSVEGRYPFLDHRVVSFCGSIPDDFKIRGLNEKFILKKLMSDKLPECIIKRPKQAFRAPIISTFITHPPEYLKLIINEKAIKTSGIFKWEEIKKLFIKANEGKLISEIDAMALTGVISGQLFSEIFIQNNSLFKPPIRMLDPNIIYQPKTVSA